MEEKIIEFVRQKDYKLLEELGQGACGKTVLLFDEILDEKFVCKKYLPFDEAEREQLFKNFVQEIKLLHMIFHPNIVRIYNYYLYPDILTGYIIMEFINGDDIESYLQKNPENINDIFFQTIEGFKYLEDNSILHRDIRSVNIMVREDGNVKIIDFGFGKKIIEKEDFDKSISLNQWCNPPNEYKDKIYNFKTEIYFVGKLFETIIKENDIEYFKHNELLKGMCNVNPDKRIDSFSYLDREILNKKFSDIEFSTTELEQYREFSNNLFSIVTIIEDGTKYYDDIEQIQKNLENVYKESMLEEYLPSNRPLTRCFLKGGYRFLRYDGMPVYVLKSFINLLKSVPKEKKNIILSNLQTKLDTIERREAKEESPF